MNREDSALLVVDVQEKLLELIPRIASGSCGTSAGCSMRPQHSAFRSPRPSNIPDELSPTVPELKERIGHAPDKLCFSACVCGDIFERWKNDNRYRVLVCGIESARVHIANGARPRGGRIRAVCGRRCGRVAVRVSIRRRRCDVWNRQASFSPRPRRRCSNGAARPRRRSSKRSALWRRKSRRRDVSLCTGLRRRTSGTEGYQH